MAKIFVVMDSTDSWTGEIRLRKAFKDRKLALKYVEKEHGVPPALFNLYLDRSPLRDLKQYEVANHLSILLGRQFKDINDNDIEAMAQSIYCSGFDEYWDYNYYITIGEVELED